MNKYLLLFTLGPVQSFIAQSRKTLDLYAGSRLLSELIKAAIYVAGGEKQLIFPKMGAAMPNRFLMEVPENEVNLGAYGQKVENAVRDKWREIAQNTVFEFQKPAGFDEQIEQHLEIFWAIEPLGENYRDAVNYLEKQVAAIKNIRSFSQYGWQNDIVGERGRKCSLDGQRNVQFYRPRAEQIQVTHPPLYSTEGGVYVKEYFFRAEVLQRGEGLSAVNFVKRKYARTAFDSTAEIALMDVLNKLMEAETGEVKTCIALIKQLNAQLFYEENTSETTLMKYLEEASVERKSAESYKKCSEIVRKAAEQAGLRMMKYYAILTFDGDDMGKWLSGENIKDLSQLRQFQEEFAGYLQDFAEAARSRLNAGSGQTVYAGGDDFIGFVNLNHLLPVLKELRQLFEEKVQIPLISYMKENKKISFSAGICVAHYKEPLSLVLQDAKNAQKSAKKLDEKDAFAISVIKGSGESHLTVLPFELGAENVERLEKLTEALIKGDFSNSFIKTVRLEFERLVDFKSQLMLKQLFIIELTRLLKRSANNPVWSKDDKKRESEQMADTLNSLFQSREMENFFQMLHIADFLQRELDNPEIQKQLSLQTA